MSTSRVAAALAVMPGARNVTGVTRVPSSRPVPRPATAPRVTHGSGIEVPGPVHLRDLDEVVHHRRARRSRPRRRPGRRRVSQASGILAPREPAHLQHHLEPLRACAGRPDAGRCSRRGGASWAHGPSRARPRARRPSPRASSCGTSARCRLSWPASVGAGTGRSRAALRRRHSASGVSITTATAGSPTSRARGQPAPAPVRRRCRGCRRRWSTRGRCGRPPRARAGRRRPPVASRSCGPLPTTPRRASEETISSRR